MLDEPDLTPIPGDTILEAFTSLDESDRGLLWSALLAPYHGPTPVSALARALQRLQAVLVNQSIPEGEELP